MPQSSIEVVEGRPSVFSVTPLTPLYGQPLREAIADVSSRSHGDVEVYVISRVLDVASVARDMVEIAKLLGQDKVQYWGFVSSHACYAVCGD